jgi:S-adenosylmethionine decarboxylase proenzyme
MRALGRHVILELYECDSEVLKDLGKVRDEMMEAARRAQATIVTTIFHEFSPFGISGVVVISASHLSIHTWPENRYAAVDIFWCGADVQPQAAIDHLAQMFGAERISVVELKRGVLVENHLEMKLDPLAGHLLQPVSP